MSFQDIISIITLLAVVIAAIVNISTMIGRSESKAAANAKTEFMLQSLQDQTKSIEKKQDTITNTITNTIQDHDKRIIICEQSTKSAHHRIDDILGIKKEKKEEGHE